MIRFAMPFADDCFVYHDSSPDYYDDIVDKTEFRPDSENVRSARARVEAADAVELIGRLLGRLVSLALDGVDVDEHGALHLLGARQHFL